MKRILPFFIIISLFLISCEKEIKVGDIEGVVLNEFGQPIEAAKIKIESRTKITDVDGKYLFQDLAAQEHTVTASKQSFLTVVQRVYVGDNQMSPLNFTLLAGEVYLNLSDSIVKVNSDSGSCNLEILSNAGWGIENTSSWLECLRKSGGGDEILEIKFSKNQEDSSRTDSIFFKSGSIKRKLVIHQSAPVKLLKYEGIIGNKEKDIEDSVYLLFNKPVTIQSIKSNWDFCITEMNYKQTDNNKGLLFSYSCASLGGKYPFTIKVTDADGYSFTYNIEVPFYESKLDIEGFMTDYLLINDEKEILISAYNPSKIIRYSIELDSIIQSYDLSSLISPIKLSYNPYNSKVYIMGSDPDIIGRNTTVSRPDVFTLNLQTNEIKKSFTIQPNEDDYPFTQAIIPYNLGFTKSGHGVVLLKDNNSSALRWKLIDCSNNDSIYNYPYYNEIIKDNTLFNNLHMNFDNSKLYLTRPYGSCDYGIFDGSSQEISILRPSSTTRGLFISVNKKEDNFFAGQLYDQFIIDLEGNMSQISYIDNRNFASADFSYRENEENIIYFCDGDKFLLMNYNNASTTMSCDIVSGLNKFTATINGEYAIAFKKNPDLSSSLFMFKTSDFYRHIE